MRHLLALTACIALMSVLLPTTDVFAQAYFNAPPQAMDPYPAPNGAWMNSSGPSQVYQPQQHLAVQHWPEPVIGQAEMPVQTYQPSPYEISNPARHRPPGGEIVPGQSEGSTSERAGLLGQSYLDAQFMLLSAPDDDAINFDPAKGARSSLNFPIPWPKDASSLFHQDMFLEFQYLSVEGTVPLADVGLQLTTGTVGTTLFVDTTDWFRPFLQLGWSYNHTSTSVDGIVLNFDEDEDDQNLLIRGGGEFDLSPNTALRLSAGNDQYANAELILWPSPRTFFRLGGVMEFDVHIYGGIAGVGFTY